MSIHNYNFFNYKMEEIWKDIIGYEGIYQISSFGRVRSSYKRGGSKRYYISNDFVLLKNVIRNNGYCFVTLRKNGCVKQCSVHRLVCNAFIPNPLNNEDINHKDGDKLNNCVTNLEWCTRQYNIKHSFEKGLHVISEKQRKNAMRPVEIVFPNGEIKKIESVKEAAKIIGYVYYNSLYKAIKNGKIKNGFKARFITKKQYY